MPRKPGPDRLRDIAAAATDEFGRSGYRATRTAEVARKAGVSTGSLFTYVESKEALFHLVFLAGFGHPEPGQLPIPTPAPGETIEVIAEGLRSDQVPRFRTALKQDAPTDVREELRGILEERYDMLDRLWPLLAVIERCAADLPDLEAFYFGNARLRYFHQLTRYLERRTAAGYLRAMPDAAVAARIITESLTWFAWKRRQGRDAALYDDDRVRQTVAEFICDALIEPRA